MTAPQSIEIPVPPETPEKATAPLPLALPPTVSPGQPVWRIDQDLIPNLDPIAIEDGVPVDGVLSEKQMRLLCEPLKSSWTPGVPFVVMANVGVFHTVGEPPLVPDVLLSTEIEQGHDFTRKENLSYFVWLRGKVPDVVVEIVSNREGGEDTTKLKAYARIHVLYYVIFDPLELLKDGILRVFALISGRYQPVSPDWLEGVGLGLKLWTGSFEETPGTWLRWCDREGHVLPTGVEQARQAAERIKRLEAQLRALGAEPANDG